MADQKQRTLAKGQFTRAENVLKKDIAMDEHSIPLITIERHQKDFLDKWEKVQDLHDEYVLSLDNPNEEELETQETWLEELSTRFSEMEVRVDTLVEQRKKEALSTGAPTIETTAVDVDMDSYTLEYRSP